MLQLDVGITCHKQTLLVVLFENLLGWGGDRSNSHQVDDENWIFNDEVWTEFKLDRDHCATFVGKTLYSNSVYLSVILRGLWEWLLGLAWKVAFFIPWPGSSSVATLMFLDEFRAKPYLTVITYSLQCVWTIGYSLQILPFLALGLGVDDMFLLAHTYSSARDKNKVHASSELWCPWLSQCPEVKKNFGEHM